MQPGGDGAPLGASDIVEVIDEEIPAVEIINLDVLKKLDEIDDEAKAYEQGDVIYALGELRKHIILLSQ